MRLAAAFVIAGACSVFTAVFISPMESYAAGDHATIRLGFASHVHCLCFSKGMEKRGPSLAKI
jgi:hypothetical protein